MASFSQLLVYTASSVQLDFVAQIYVAIYFHTAPGFVWLFPYNSWFYMATFIQLLVLFGFFPMSSGFVWFLAIGF